jgi:hypothetical protein
MPEQNKFLHVRSSKGFPIATVCTQFTEDRKEVYYSIATAKYGTIYNKSVGCKVAARLLVVGKGIRHVNIENVEPKAKNINKLVLEDIVSKHNDPKVMSMSLPKHVLAAIVLMLETHYNKEDSVEPEMAVTSEDQPSTVQA